MVRATEPNYAGFDGSGPIVHPTGPSVRAPAIALIIVAASPALMQIYSVAKADENVAEMKRLAQDPGIPQQWCDIIQKVADSADAATVRRNGGIMLGLNVLTVLARR